MSTCPHEGKWFGGCRFEARYDRSEPKGIESFHYTGMNGAERLEQLRQITYVRDVCVRCGRSVER